MTIGGSCLSAFRYGLPTEIQAPRKTSDILAASRMRCFDHRDFKLSESPFANRRRTESNSWRLIMRATFGLLFYLLLSPLVFAHEHTNAVPEIDRKFLDDLQRPDNRPDDRRDKKSKSCCTDKDAVK